MHVAHVTFSSELLCDMVGSFPSQVSLVQPRSMLQAAEAQPRVRVRMASHQGVGWAIRPVGLSVLEKVVGLGVSGSRKRRNVYHFYIHSTSIS